MPGSLRSLGDSTLAARAVGGDGEAFAELERRYRGLIWQTVRRPAFGLSFEDQRQEALIGLFVACRAHDPVHGRFGGMATVCVRRHVMQARRRAKLHRHRVLTEALGLDAPDDHDGTQTLAERLGDDRDDPVEILQRREELFALASVPRNLARLHGPSQRTNRRRYTAAEVRTALALVAEGKSLRQAAAAIGAGHATVLGWLRNAA